jgi:GntR family transcriptional regulator
VIRQAAVRVPSLAAQVLAFLTEAIMGGGYPPGSQLPAEVQLATDFKVSRGTIRSAIDSLELRGLVVRRQGVGTFVTSASRITNALNEVILWDDIIEAQGYRAGMEILPASIISADDNISKALQVGKGSEILQIPKIFTADDNPVIYSWNSMPTSFFSEKALSQVLANSSISEPWFQFLSETCGQTCHHFIASLRPDIAQNCNLNPAIFEPHTPLLIIEEVGYNTEELPFVHNLEYYPGQFMNFQVFRSMSRLNTRR